MDEEKLNASLRKFLKTVGVTSQREIEKTVRAAAAEGRLKGLKSVPVEVVLTMEQTGLRHRVAGSIDIA